VRSTEKANGIEPIGSSSLPSAASFVEAPSIAKIVSPVVAPVNSAPLSAT
jgi:ethanolamine transporter EutH